MKKQLIIVGVLACSFASTGLFAQKNEGQKEKVERLGEIVVTATKFNLKKENTGKVIHVITSEDLRKNAGRSVVQVLNTIAGIDVRGVNANPTEPRGINIRGGRARQVLVLIDGVPVTDQSAINQEFDLRLLSVNQIERIEVLKGASSTLYGSGAATAVINIQLKKATKDTVSGSFETVIGTNNTADNLVNRLTDRQQNAIVKGNIGDFNYLASFSLKGVDGMSSAKSKTNDAFENDAFFSKNGLLKLGYNVSKKINFEAFLNFDAFKYDFDAGAFSDNELNKGNQEQFRIGIKQTYRYKNGELYLLASLNEVKRTLDQFNSFANTLDFYSFEGRSLFLDVVNKYSFSNKFQLITGFNYQEHQNNTVTPFATIADEVANFNTIDPYISGVFISDFGVSVNAGARLSMHNVYGNQFVYDATISYNLLKNKTTNIKLLTSYSTAFIAPSLYQLYDGFAGNIDLQPETNETFEIGFDANYKSWLQLDAVYFNRTETNAIIFDNNTFTYGNGSSNASGIELNTRVNPFNTVTLNVSYTYINPFNFEDFNDYIPENKFVLGVDYQATKKWGIHALYKNVGERTIFDRFGSFGTAGEDVFLEAYQVVDVLTNYTLLNETVTFFGGVTNLLNENYDDILGFSTRGRNYKIGVRLQF